MTDTPSKPRKTLTIKKAAAAAASPAADSAERRKRSGARARQVAQMEIARGKNSAGAQADAGTTTPRRDPAPARKRGAAAGTAPARETTTGARPGRDDGKAATRYATERGGKAASARQSRHPGEDAGAARHSPGRSRNSNAARNGPGGDRGASASPRPSSRDGDTGRRSFGHSRDRGIAPAPEAPAAEMPETAAAPRISRRPRRIAPARIFPVFAPCPHGLEAALAAELQALGFDAVAASRAGCSFEADWNGVQRANLYSRLATRVLVQVAQRPVHREDDIYELALDTPWEDWFGAEQTLRVDTSAIHSPMKSLQFCNLRAKDGICDRLREREGARPDIDTVRPDARVHLFLTEDTGTLYLDTSGESLFKRGWRLDKGEAPLRENLAAGLLALSGWDPALPLVDPFCGSGTILIEAAWIALGVPPGIWRPFGFERLRNHDARRWRDIKEEARSHIAPRLDTPLIGYDLDPAAIDAARLNLERAWLTPQSLRLEIGDARQVTPPAEAGWLVTNPPYGERMAGDGEDLWPAWAENLKRHYSGWSVNVITSDLDLPRRLRLKPLRRHPLHNGALDCRLFSFEMVQASYRR
ncbi:THUMP domain-containing protein [Candidimonas nitroreducens]|uniref:DNA methyltransferase n=1 Tax=Candidimonas nitroreducens TaxID=683354 RepID=A0A225M7W6_9BURK|nr:class I SAM-dependent RNA methyltransferase [Candidimonas nitroreducens]OWT57417.1 DNA methyltransferase [Candidimonas nitroreducens]